MTEGSPTPSFNMRGEYLKKKVRENGRDPSLLGKLKVISDRSRVKSLVAIPSRRSHFPTDSALLVMRKVKVFQEHDKFTRN